jgi:hypothetical protein
MNLSIVAIALFDPIRRTKHADPPPARKCDARVTSVTGCKRRGGFTPCIAMQRLQ